MTRFMLAIATLVLSPSSGVADPPSAPATQADIERLEKKIEAQQRLIENLVRLQQQYAAALGQLVEGTPAVALDPAAGKPPEPKPVPKPKPAIKPVGTIAGKVQGASDAYVYVDDLVASASGSAAMIQEGKQFVPHVLAVQKGTRVDFPNHDAIFHNVFSVTPENSFDLGSYRQGESKSVTLVKPGVVNVYCNIHPRMVGYILVVPNGYFVRVAEDGKFKLANVPAGHHRIVAWAPNAKPVTREVDVGESATAAADFTLAQRAATSHTNKDGMPYGSYKE
jgi:plastocyanin